MKVTLISITKPVIDACNTPGDLLAYVARVSNPDNQSNTDTAPRLLRYLKKHGHWSPFEHVYMTLEITTTRDISRQITRHRSFVFQEFSGRYSAMPGEPVIREARMQDSTNRQNSLAANDPTIISDWERDQMIVYNTAQDVYQNALQKGIAKEVARAILPEGMTKTTIYMTGSLRSWLHYVELRTQPETQAEHRVVAKACEEILYGQFPDLAP